MVYSLITCSAVTRWVSTVHDMRRPQHKKTVGHSDPLNAGYRARVLASTGRDPLRCTRCGGEMMLWKVWHPRYDVVYNELREIKRGRCGLRRDIPPDASANGDGEKLMIHLALTGLQVWGEVGREPST